MDVTFELCIVRALTHSVHQNSRHEVLNGVDLAAQNYLLDIEKYSKVKPDPSPAIAEELLAPTSSPTSIFKYHTKPGSQGLM